MFFDPLYFLIVGPAMIIALIAQVRVKSAFTRYSKIRTQRGMSGAETAAAILKASGIHDVTIEQTRGFLSDHYDPRSKTLRLSPDVYSGRSVAAVGVAAHEVGHAIQHARNYVPLALRSAIVPMANFGSWLAWPMIFIGALLNSFNLILAGVIAFSALVLFQLITLPVEFDASHRAVQQLDGTGLLARGTGEREGVKKVLTAAALTYVAATITAIAQLLYFLLRLGILGGRDE